MSKLDDCTREYLVTKFVCAECGRALKLSYVRAAASGPIRVWRAHGRGQS